MRKNEKQGSDNVPTKITRRDMLKLSALTTSAVMINPSSVIGSISPFHIDQNSKTDNKNLDNSNPYLVRQRPTPLDIFWAKGTGMIWMEGETLFYDNPRNRYMRFRRSFDLNENIKYAEIRIFADTNYRLWINGKEVGFGPGRSDKTWTYYDTYDVRAFLKTGTNSIAVLGLFHGFGTGGRQSIMQALLVHLEIEGLLGKKIYIVSDKQWRTSPANEFIRPTPRIHATLGCVEVRDLRLADNKWIETGYDDGDWSMSDYVKSGLRGTVPWYHFVPEVLPHRTLTDLSVPKSVQIATIELSEPPVELLGGMRPPVSGYEGKIPLTLQGTPSKKVSIVTLDMKRTENGFLTIDITGSEGSVIDVLCGEILVDGQIPKPGSSRIHTTRFILKEGRQLLKIEFNWIAFRFAQLWIWSEKQIQIHDAVLRNLLLPLGKAGHFMCNDNYLNRLDEICEHTLRLCTQDGIVDSSSREQQQWIGDARFIVRILHHRFDIGVIHRRLLEQIGQGIDWMGSMSARYPTGNINITPIPLYNLHWILSIQEYEFYTGDNQLSLEWWPQIQQVTRFFTAFERKDDGLLEKVPFWMMADSGAMGTPVLGAVNSILNINYYAVLLYTHKLAVRYNDKEYEIFYKDRFLRLFNSIKNILWDDNLNVYVDSLDIKNNKTTISEATNAFALIYLEEKNSIRSLNIIKNVFENRNSKIIGSGVFNMNIVLEALAKHSCVDIAMKILKERYVQMVESGSTWEHWTDYEYINSIPVSHSLSHAWGASPLQFFQNAILGIYPIDKAWSTIKIEPQIGHLSSAEGSIVTVKGQIMSSWKIKKGMFHLTVKIPQGVKGICVLPDGTEHSILTNEGYYTCKLKK